MDKKTEEFIFKKLDEISEQIKKIQVEQESIFYSVQEILDKLKATY